nr:RNA-binding S4 domain-containing protein [Paenibacillus hemerocallicola]
MERTYVSFLHGGKLMITTGGQVKPFLLEQKIVVNGDPENRRGRKLYPGDTI